MRRIGLLHIAGVRVRVYEHKLKDCWGTYDPVAARIVVMPGLDRHMLISTLVHEIVHAVDHLYLAGTRPNSEHRSQALGAALASCWDELVRIAGSRRARR